MPTDEGGFRTGLAGAQKAPKKAIFAIAENVLDIAVEGVTSSVSGGKLNELFEPLPLNLNVNSPDFRYDDFMSKDMGSGQFGPRVDPDSPIRRRLAGE